MVDFMGSTADDLQRAKHSQLRMADGDLIWRVAHGFGPVPCRHPQADQPNRSRELLVAARLSEGVLVKAGNAAAGIIDEGE